MKKSLLILVVSFILISQIQAIEKENKGHKMSSETNKTADDLLNRADDVFQLREYQEALDLYEKAYKLAHEEFNRSVEVEALSQMARMNLILGNKEQGAVYLEQVKEKISDDDPMGWSRYLSVRGRYEWKGEDLISARKTFDEMYDYCQANALYGRAVDAANMMAIVSVDPKLQIEWSYKGIDAAEASDNEKWLGPLWNNLAATYYDLKQYDSALECYQKSREYHWRFSGEIAKLYADYHIGMTYRYLGKIDEAQKWLRPILAWAERLDNHSAIGQACEDLGECEITLGNKAEGLKLLTRARSEYKKEGYDKSWPEIWDNINKRIKELSG